MTETKDKRSANFTRAEIDLLVDLVSKYKSVLENKKTDATTWKDKADTWILISNEFNASSGNFSRSDKALKAKYDGIKKNCATLRKEKNKTGGGLPDCTDLTAFEEKVMSMTQYSMLGLASRFDNDNPESTPIVDDEHEDIEYIEDDDVMDFLKSQGELNDNGESSTWTERTTQHTKHQSIQSQDQASTLNTSEIINDIENDGLTNENHLNKYKRKTQNITLIQTSRFIHKNKKSKRTTPQNYPELITSKKEVLGLQKQCLQIEKDTKERARDLIIKNLEMDLD